MAVTVAQWLSALQSLLPPGDALTREPGATLTKLLGALAAQLADAQARAEALQEQSSNPLVAIEMLPDWERLLGLPDDCMVGVSLSLLERQSIAGQRLVEMGGQSRAYFIDLAARLDEPGCSITEHQPFTCNDRCNDAIYTEPDRFVWRMHIPHPADNARAFNCNDDCQDPLQQYTPSLIECPINERKPAHTKVLFTYA